MPIIASLAGGSARGFGGLRTFGAALPPDAGAMVPLGMVQVASNTSTISFTSIPQTYKNLQIRGIARTNRSATIDGYAVKLNGNGATKNHELRGDGSSASAGAGNVADGLIAGGNATAGVFGTFVTDILDYSSTTKNKTVRSIAGYDNNGSGEFNLTSGFQNATTAITSIDIVVSTGNSYVQYSQFALYGIKGA